MTYFSRHSFTYVYWLRGSPFFASILARFLSRFSVFQGICNPYYEIYILSRLRRLWVHIEFWSPLLHVFTRFFA